VAKDVPERSEGAREWSKEECSVLERGLYMYAQTHMAEGTGQGIQG
jgi:hypothetical protein